jgi:nitric oxide reductase NorQ protein
MLSVPDVKTFLISEENAEILEAVDKRTARGEHTNLMLLGEQGCGKSEFATQYAATRKRPFAVIEIGRLAEASQIFGYTDLDGDKTKYVEGLFLEAIKVPNAVIHLQEINRPESDKALNSLFSILDNSSREIWLDEIQATVKVAPGVTFFASLNEGYEYIGTIPVDEALRGRFPSKIYLKSLPTEVERDVIETRIGLPRTEIDGFMDVVEKLRTNTQAKTHVSTRDVLNMAEWIKDGLSMFVALKTVIGKAEDATESVLLAEHFAGRDVEGVAGENDKFYPMSDAAKQMQAKVAETLEKVYAAKAAVLDEQPDDVSVGFDRRRTIETALHAAGVGDQVTPTVDPDTSKRPVDRSLADKLAELKRKREENAKAVEVLLKDHKREVLGGG